MKILQHPRGPTRRESGILGAAGQLRVDEGLRSLRLHDGMTPGGSIIPSLPVLDSRFARLRPDSNTNQAGIQYFTTQTALQEFVPYSNAIAILAQDGREEIFIWNSGVNPGSGITSNHDGYWARLSSQLSEFIRMAAAGMFAIQYGGSAPSSDQDTTVWVDNNVVKLYDGASYAAVTPALYTRLLSSIGGYATSVTLPNRLADTLVEAADVNAVTDSGWYKTAAADANAPTATPSALHHFKFTSNSMMQIVYLQDSATRDSYVRFKASGTWGAWTLVPGAHPGRLAATSGAISNCNDATDTGFYGVPGSTTNAPVTEEGTLYAIRRSSSAIVQTFASTDSDKIYARRYVSGVWQSWKQVYPADGAAITGTVPRVNIGISTISQAEAEAGTATTDRIWTAERVKQAIAAHASAPATLVVPAITASGSAVTIIDIPAYRQLEIRLSRIQFAASETLQLKVSTNNGSGYHTAKTCSAPTGGSSQHLTGLILVDAADNLALYERSIIPHTITEGGTVFDTMSIADISGPINAIQLVGAVGTTFNSGKVELWGIK